MKRKLLPWVLQALTMIGLTSVATSPAFFCDVEDGWLNFGHEEGDFDDFDDLDDLDDIDIDVD